MENQTISTSAPVEQPQVSNQPPSMRQFVPLPNSASLEGPIVGVQQESPNSPMQFLMRTVERLLPNHQQSTPSNPSPAAAESSTISLPYNNQPPQQYQQPYYPPQQQEEESNYWAGSEELTQFLEENGVNSIPELLQYTAGQEQSAEQMQEIFEYAMHPDPAVRSQFWEHYEQALSEQGVTPERQQQYQPPSLPGTPDTYGYGNTNQGFSSVNQFADQFALMQSGLPAITPQALAEFDRAILMTPGAFWAQNVFEFGDI